MKDILNKIPSAEVAALEARNVRGARAENEAHRVVPALLAAIERGEASVVIEPPFTGLALIEHLKREGYSVRHRQTGPNESGTEISW